MGLIIVGTFVIVSIVVGVLVFALRDDKDKPPRVEINPESIPFNLFLDEEIESTQELVAALQDAITFINESVGAEMFAEIGDLSGGDVVSIMSYDNRVIRNPLHIDSFGYVSFKEGKVESIYLNFEKYVSMLDDSLSLKFACAHELGHVLGLDHDDFTSSFMYGKVLSKEPEMTFKDRIFLRTAYGLDNEHSAA